MYDVYLFKGIHNLSELEAPELKEPVVQQRLMQSSPHFLGLDLDADSAVDLLQYLRNEKAIGYIVPVAYRQPRITVEQAAPVAEQAIVELKETQYPANPLGSIHFVREEPVSWVFGATQNGKNQKLYAHVDKLDGHLWQPKELERLWDEAYFLEKIGRKGKSPYVIVVDGSDQGYDLYLIKGAYTLPALEDLSQVAPVLRDPGLRQQLAQHSHPIGFLELALPKDIVLSLFQRLYQEGAEGYIVPVAYRQPRITVEQATLIAERHFEMVKATERPDDTLGSVRFRKEEPVFWVFEAPSEQFLKEGRVPTVLFTNVDKLDGHIWRKEELIHLWEGV